MCGCRGSKILASRVMSYASSESIPNELVMVTSQSGEPIYGCVTGSRYAFDEQETLYIDNRDAACLSEEFSIL